MFFAPTFRQLCSTRGVWVTAFVAACTPHVPSTDVAEPPAQPDAEAKAEPVTHTYTLIEEEKPEPRVLPELNKPAVAVVPTRPAANISILSTAVSADTASWWDVQGGFIELDTVTANTLGLAPTDRLDPLEGRADFEPIVDLGSTVLWVNHRFRGDEFIAASRSDNVAQWNVDLRMVGRCYLNTVTASTLVTTVYDDDADTLVGFALDSGHEVWRIEGGERAAIRRLQSLWAEGNRGFTRGDRSLMAFDAASGVILWAQPGGDVQCSISHGEGVIVVETPKTLRVIDNADGAAIAEFVRPDGATKCNGAVAEAVIEAGTLYMFGPTSHDAVGTMYAIELATGALRWKRPKLDATVLVADQDVVVVRRDEKMLVLDVATGDPLFDLSAAGEFSVEVVHGGGVMGPLMVLDADMMPTPWLLGRAEHEMPKESYTIRGRVVVQPWIKRSRTVGVKVRVGSHWTTTDERGRFKVRGRNRGAVAIHARGSLDDDWSYLHRFVFDSQAQLLDGSRTYDVGDLDLYDGHAE